MAVRIVPALPVDSRWIPVCAEQIIDKKIMGLALNRLEIWLDWLCTRLFSPYSRLEQAKIARVHSFSTGVKLFDATKDKIITMEKRGGYDHIILNGHSVQFDDLPCVHKQFDLTTTAYVVVKDHEQAGWIKIIEQEPSQPGNPGMAKCWQGDISKEPSFDLSASVAYGSQGYLVTPCNL